MSDRSKGNAVPATVAEDQMPTPELLGERAAAMMCKIEKNEGYDRLIGSAMLYSTCWATFTGYPLVAKWSLERDTGPLLTEALRVLALKAAVFELTGGDEYASELLVAAPVDEMVHAVLAQFTLMSRMQTELAVTFPHVTELERFTYTHGCLTDTYYAAAGWGPQPRRYWLDAAEATRRLRILNTHYRHAGMGRDGRSHNFDFAVEPLAS